MTALVPSLPGVVGAAEVRETAAAIARAQERSGAIPWFPGGQVDVWDHVESAMALLVGGEQEAAERAYRWLFDTQRPDGSWPIRATRGVVEDPGADSNMCAYVAVGAWHHWLVRRDEAFVRRAWPVVRRALDLVVGMQLSFGGIAWARDAQGRQFDEALVAGSSSIHHALACGLALGDLLDEPQPEWELAAGRIGHALREHEELFAQKTRYSMDWYYPVLGGAVRGADARRRIDVRWPDFVVDGLGIRCVDDHPWVTGAETCELALALDATGRPDQALVLVADMQHLRDPDGSYGTGYVFADDARWPEEQTTWTAAAMVLAVDALAQTTPGADIFRGTTYANDFPEIGLECGCGSADRVAGVSTRPR
ncbi:MAG: prenyltransferase [Nocardioidaceae bacterium]